MRDAVYVQSGPGGWWVKDGLELVHVIFVLLGFSVYMSIHNRCTCGCDDRCCDYCPWECEPQKKESK